MFKPPTEPQLSTTDRSKAVVLCGSVMLPVVMSVCIWSSAIWSPEWQLFGKELFIGFTMRVFPDRLSVCVCLLPFCFGSKMWDLIVLTPDI